MGRVVGVGRAPRGHPSRCRTRGDSPMRFNPKARLDTSRVRDVGGSGGRGGGGGMRIPSPGGTKAGGGIGGVLVIILFLVLTKCVGGGTGGGQLPDTGLDTARMQGSD